jgi:diguanylate cyclase (GGDEF)-like protein
MVRLVSCITEEHSWPLLLVAICVCVVGLFAGVFMLSRARQCVKAHRNIWLTVAGLVIGGSIWATHFIAMLSYSIPVSYRLTETALSIVVAVGISCLATFASSYVPGRQGSFTAGALLGLAIATMHAVGLTAIRGTALVEADAVPTVIAWVVGGIFAIAGMLLLSRTMSSSRLIGASLLFAAAVCGHHMISMSGLEVVPLYPETGAALTFIDRVGIAVGVCAVSSMVIATGIAALFFDRHLTDVKGLANATFEAVVLTRDGVIVHANERFATFVGRSISDLKSLPLDKFLTIRDGMRSSLTSDAGSFPVEIVEGVIEFRGRETNVYGLRDLTERLETHRQLEHLASHDPLTGLLNRRAFNGRAEQAVTLAPAEERRLVLLTLDLDRFKSINDAHGHAQGDRVLQQFAEIFSAAFDASAIVGRLGGDEFAALLPDTDLERAYQLASTFMDEFRSTFAIHEKAGALGVSIGIACFPEHGSELRQLQTNADAALYRAKLEGKGRICTFDRFLDQEMRERSRLEVELRRAAQKGELFLLYQPIVDNSSRLTKGREALLRWRHPLYGILAPAVFMKAAEDSGSIVEIGNWILHEACRQAVLWNDELFVAVNVSARQLLSLDLIGHVTDALDATGLAPGRLELEITETSLLEDRPEVAQNLAALKALGAKIVMDDYGSGYSSMTNLRRYPFDKIKIDRASVAALDDDPVAEVIIDCALALARSLGLAVVVEGIETEEQRVRLAEKAPDQLQGFLFGRPVPGHVPLSGSFGKKPGVG